MDKNIKRADIDHILAHASLDPETLSALKINGEPDIDLALYLVEHPRFAPLMLKNQLDDELHELLVELFIQIARRLGISSAGNLLNLSQRARTRLDAERRKYALVLKHLALRRDDPQASVKLLRNYLGTAPAPLLVDEIAAAYPQRLAEAQADLERGADLLVLLDDAALLKALTSPDPAEASELRRRLKTRLQRVQRQVDGGPEMVEAFLRRAIKTGSPDAQFMAAALAAFATMLDLVADILAIFLAGGHHAPHLAVMAAQIDPMVVRNALAQFLVDIAYQNPEEPEAKINAERTHTILSARTLLPLIGSPLAEVQPDELPNTPEFAEIRHIPALLRQSWHMWEQIKARPD